MALLTTNFTEAEAVVTDHRQYVSAQRAYFEGEVREVFVRYLLECWEPVRQIVGPLLISSAVRCPDLNRAVGGSPCSWHMVRTPGGLGAATDCVPRSSALLAAYRAIAFGPVPFHELILEYNSWIHLGWRADGPQGYRCLMKFEGSPYLAFNPQDPRLAAA